MARKGMLVLAQESEDIKHNTIAIARRSGDIVSILVCPYALYESCIAIVSAMLY